MIKFTRVPSLIANAPILYLIAGGPGLSSNTLRSLESLKDSFDLHFVDLPGAGGNLYQECSFEELVNNLKDAIVQERKPVYVLGHSFGGFLAAAAAIQSKNVAGIIELAVPFSKASLFKAGENYERHLTSSMKELDAIWNRSHTRESLNEWLASYGKLYFVNSQKGAELLCGDLSSPELFLAYRKVAIEMEHLLEKIFQWGGKKLFIAGTEDQLLDVSLIKSEAERAGAQFYSVEQASHFVMFDQPELVAGLVRSLIATNGEIV